MATCVIFVAPGRKGSNKQLDKKVFFKECFILASLRQTDVKSKLG